MDKGLLKRVVEVDSELREAKGYYDIINNDSTEKEKQNAKELLDVLNKEIENHDLFFLTAYINGIACSGTLFIDKQEIYFRKQELEIPEVREFAQNYRTYEHTILRELIRFNN